MYLSKITAIGHIGKDAEKATTGSGKEIIRFSFAVSVGYGDKKTTNWFDVLTFSKLPDWKFDLLKKGANAVVQGDFKETVSKKDGKNYHHLNILADTIEVFSKKEEGGEASSGTLDDDVVPF